MSSSNIRVLDRALEVMNYLARSVDPQGLSAIAEATHLSGATVYRLLSTLKDWGVVIQGVDSLYMIGPATLLWSDAYRSRMVLEYLFHEQVGALHHISGETIHLFVFEGGSLFYAAKEDSPQTVIMRSRIGLQASLYSTSGGRAVLAALPEAERNEYLDRTSLVAHTQYTETDKAKFLKLLQEGKCRGWQEEIEENEEGIRCIASPILDRHGYPVGALSVSAPSYRMDDKKVQHIGPTLMKTAHSISLKLGAAQKTDHCDGAAGSFHQTEHELS